MFKGGADDVYRRCRLLAMECLGGPFHSFMRSSQQKGDQEELMLLEEFKAAVILLSIAPFVLGMNRLGSTGEHRLAARESWLKNSAPNAV